jgi:hypothetical protein
LGLTSEPRLDKASVRGGLIREWKGLSGSSYKALVNGLSDQVVNGHIFEVQSESQEMALRSYETARYEVVRCLVSTEDGKEVQALTFRFVDYGELA